MNKTFAYLLILLLVTTTTTQVFQSYFSDSITELSENCQDEPSTPEPRAPEYFSVTFSFSEHQYSIQQKAKFALYQHITEGENHSSVIDSPPESL